VKEITIRELYEKLVDRYKERFPHNPLGVLQLHVDRIVQEGKSKEDAVIVLSKREGIEVSQRVTGKFPELQKAKSADLDQQSGLLIGGMNESEYQACMDGLGLLEGEEMRLRYVCFRRVRSPPSIWNGKQRMEQKKGLLVFTNDNMVFMQQEGAWSSNYAQALRVPLEQIVGVVSGGAVIKHIRISVGVSGTSELHEFINFFSTYGKQTIHEVRGDIEKLLKDVRREKKRLAQAALAKGTVPTMIFCRFCGTRNKSDRSHCANCGAPLD